MNRLLRKFIFVFIILSFSFAPVQGQETGKSFLWKVEKSNGSCYLLGSIHMLKEEHYPLNPAIEKAYAQSDALAAEIDMTGSNALAITAKLMQSGMYPDGQTLETSLSQKTYDLLLKKLSGLGMTVDSLQSFKPWMVAMVIMQSEFAELGFNPQLGVDMYFLNKAVEDNKPIAEVEGAEFQLNLFNSFTKSESEAFLLSTIMETEQLKSQMQSMIDSWLSGDAEALNKLMTGYIGEEPGLEDIYKRINDDRNVGMVKKIVEYLNSGKIYMVVVGAAHMVGPKGIVQLLKDKGYTVIQQ